jgi:hypothetical protein
MVLGLKIKKLQAVLDRETHESGLENQETCNWLAKRTSINCCV